MRFSRWTHLRLLSIFCVLGACGDPAPETNELPSTFPGAPVSASNLASDGRAFSNAREQVEAVRTFFNADDGTAIVLLHTKTTEEVEGSFSGLFLYASFFDGKRFTPPVSVRGEGDDVEAAPTMPRVLFLNTPSRRGDAIITFVRSEAAVSDRDEDRANESDRLFAAYFDRSESQKAASGELRHGFTPIATALDFDHDVTEGDDPDVIAVALVSDSLRGTHDFAHEPVEMRSGDPTSAVHIVFAKAQSNGAAQTGVVWQAVRFDLDQRGHTFTRQTTESEGTLASAGGPFVNDAMTGSFDSVDVDRGGGGIDEARGGTAYVHDNHFFWVIEELGADDEDAVLTDSVFASDGAVTPLRVGSAATSDADFTGIRSEEHVFGPDQGLDSLLVLVTEGGFSDGQNGSRASDTDLVAVRIAADGTSQEALEIDAFTAPIDETDADGDEIPANTAASSIGDVHARIARDGSYVAVLFTQENRTRGDLDDNDPETTNGPTNSVVYAQVIKTSDRTPLASSALSTPVKIPALESSGDNFPPPDPETGLPAPDDAANVRDVAFQIELGTGEQNELTYQSDPRRMFFSFTQATGAIPPGEMLLVNSLEVELGSREAAPTLSVGEPSFESSIVTLPNGVIAQDPAYDVELGTIVVDREDAPKGYLAFFFANANNTGDAGVEGATREPRLYAFDGVTTVLVSTAAEGSARLPSPESLFVRTVGTRSGSRVHVLWQERIRGSAATELCTRSFEKRRNAFAPAAAEPPVVIDLPSENVLVHDADFFVEGETVGVYFIESGHLFYEETRGDATRYHRTPGARDPALVDTDNTMDFLVTAETFAPRFTRDLSGAITIFQKADLTEATRAYIRVHD